MRRLQKVLLIASAFVFLSACANHKDVRNLYTPAIRQAAEAPTVTRTVIVSKTAPSATVVVPTKKPTATLTPTVTQTPVPSPTATLPKFPILSPDDAMFAVMEKYESLGDGSCELPCWWGITPGETSLSEARAILSPLGQEHLFLVGDFRKFDYVFMVPPEIEPLLGAIEPSLWEANNIVAAIGLNSWWISPDFDYSLVGILKNFGQPDEIWVNLITDTQFVPHYEMELFFSTQGILFSSTGDAKLDQDGLFICPQEFKRGVFSPGVLLFSNTGEVQYNEIDSGILARNPESDIYEFKLLSQIADGFDEERFYQTYISPTSACISINAGY